MRFDIGRAKWKKNHAQQSGASCSLTANQFVDNKRKTVASIHVSRNFNIKAIVLT